MKSYEQAILEHRPEDSSEEQFITRAEYIAIAQEMRDHIIKSSSEVSRIVKSKHDDPDEQYGIAYRKGYFCLGLANILELKKLIHVFEILEFVLDSGRWNKDFTKYSMTYLVELIFDTSKEMLNDFIDQGKSSLDLKDLVSECHTYLAAPLKDYNAKIEKLFATEAAEKLIITPNEFLLESSDYGRLTSPLTPEMNIAPLPDISDDAEELILSPDKVALVPDFCEEASDNLDEVELTLIELEGSDKPLEFVNKIFRAIHTVKGGSRLLEIKKIETLAHQMESLLDDIRSQKINVSAKIIDVLMEGNSALLLMVGEVRELTPIETKISHLVARIHEIRKGESNTHKLASIESSVTNNETEELKAAPEEKNILKSIETVAPVEETIRVPANRLDDVLNTASEVFITRIRLQNDVQVLTGAINGLEKITRSAKLESVAESLEFINNKCSQLELEIISQRQNSMAPSDKPRRLLKQIKDTLKADIFRNLEKFPEESRLTLLRIEDNRKQLQKNVDDLEGLSARLQTGAMGFRMVPIAQLLNRFPAQVRELSRKIGKKAKLTISGADTELDKLLINQLADPLIHIMRNSMDHGFETAEQRLALGKPEVGEIQIRAFYQGSNAVIEVTDDGAGINQRRVLAKAIESKLISKADAENLNEKEILDLVFEPGLSTAKEVTELSGRGVGMDVVKTAISSVQGNVQVESKDGVGTTVTMRLPLTLAIVGILLVTENGHQFAFPVLNVVEVLAIKRKELKKVGESLVFNYRGITLNVSSLSKYLNFPSSAFEKDECSIIVLTDGDHHLGIIVDEIKGKQDVLIKQFGSLLSKIDLMMGCTILSDSSLVLIVNIWELMTSNTNSELKLNTPVQDVGVRLARKNHRVLVVDDSAMQRSRMSSILTQAGYLVEVAVDGHDALQKIKTTDFSVFCVDIIMPLMDGYEFIEKLRAVVEHHDSTVFLITGKTITEGAEQRRLQSLNVAQLFKKPVPEQEFIDALDAACFGSIKQGK
jgi:two-component system, chemotaxis family, sensor kinase CheA